MAHKPLHGSSAWEHLDRNVAGAGGPSYAQRAEEAEWETPKTGPLRQGKPQTGGCTFVSASSELGEKGVTEDN